MTKPQFSRLSAGSETLMHAGLIAVCLLCAAFGESARLWFRYERSGLLDGEWWRVFTGHVVHLGVVHTLLNLAGFVLLVWLFRGDIRRWEWLSVGAVAAAAIAAGLYLFSPATQWYVGLSGVLHGWFAFGAARTCHSQPRLAVIMLTGLAGKLVWEQTSGTMPFTAALSIGPVVVDAHLYGALGGVLSYVISQTRMLVGSSG